MSIRVCPMRDAICPHGMNCPYVGDDYYGYPCKDGWRGQTEPTLREIQRAQSIALRLPTGLSCICPPADKGHAYGKINPGCPIHAQPVEVVFNLPGEPEAEETGHDQ